MAARWEERSWRAVPAPRPPADAAVVTDGLRAFARHLERHLPLVAFLRRESPFDGYLGNADCLAVVADDLPASALRRALATFEPPHPEDAAGVFERRPIFVPESLLETLATHCLAGWRGARPLAGGVELAAPSPTAARLDGYWSTLHRLAAVLHHLLDGAADAVHLGELARTFDRALATSASPVDGASRAAVERAAEVAATATATDAEAVPPLLELAVESWRWLATAATGDPPLPPLEAEEDDELYLAKLGTGRHLVVYDFDVEDERLPVDRFVADRFVADHGRRLREAGQPVVHLQLPLAAAGPVLLEVAAAGGIDRCRGWRVDLSSTARRRLDQLAERIPGTVEEARSRIRAWHAHHLQTTKEGLPSEPLPSFQHLPRPREAGLDAGLLGALVGIRNNRSSRSR